MAAVWKWFMHMDIATGCPPCEKSSVVYRAPNSSTKTSGGTGGVGKLDAVMYDLAACAFPGYFRRSPPVAFRAVFYSGETRAFFFLTLLWVFIITRCFCCPLISTFALFHLSSLKRALKIS